MTTVSPETTPDKKQTIRNILAIIGFIGAIALLAWLAIAVVRVLPSTFSSLASLADQVYNGSGRMGQISVTQSGERVDNGQTITLSWEKAPVAGSYTFSHACVEGVTLEIVSGDTNQPVRCDMVYSLGETQEVTLKVASEKAELTEVPYTISFLRPNDSRARMEGSASFAALNTALIPPPTGGPRVEIAIKPDTPQPTPIEAPETPTTPQTPTRGTPEPQYETYTYFPVSNPNGTTDLAVRFIEMGVVNGTMLTPRSALTAGAENFFRFEVINLGTKTSDTWNLTMKLPGDASYERDNQAPLKPNERAVITARFAVDASDRGDTISVTVTTDSDTTKSNNTLRWGTGTN